ncbi:hypothetical protein K2X33_15745 [bacterium]|nr:hypothetical protein [bacterium]
MNPVDTNVQVEEKVSGLKGKEKRPVPSVLKMIEADPELRDFFKLIHENGWRDKAAGLLAERLQK